MRLPGENKDRTAKINTPSSPLLIVFDSPVLLTSL